jgi:hypothetical protein
VWLIAVASDWFSVLCVCVWVGVGGWVGGWVRVCVRERERTEARARAWQELIHIKKKNSYSKKKIPIAREHILSYRVRAW